MGAGSKQTTHKVKAAEPFEAVYNLNLADNIPPAINSRYLFIYSTENETKSPEEFRHPLIDRLINGLSSLVNHTPEENVLSFPQLLGKIHQEPSNGRYAIKITKSSSIPFVVATHDEISFQHLQPESGFPSRVLDPRIFAAGIETIAKPDRTGGCQVFRVQLTFIDGGFVLCISKHHNVLDDTSLGYLVRWWFKRARSFARRDEPLELKVETTSRALSVHDQNALIKFKEVPQQDHPEWKVIETATPHMYGLEMPTPGAFSVAKGLFHKLPPSDTTIFFFPPSSLKQLRSNTPGRPEIGIRLREAVYALIWRCITRTRIRPNKAKSRSAPFPSQTMLVVPHDGRASLDPPLAPEYFGNATFYSPVSMPIPALMGGHGVAINDVAMAIHEGLRITSNNNHLRSVIQLMASQTKATSVVNSFHICGGYDVCIVDLESTFGDLAELRLGCGDFQTVRQPGGAAFDGMVVVLPSFGQRDVFGLEVAVELNASHMKVLKKDFEWKQYTECMEWEN